MTATKTTAALAVVRVPVADDVDHVAVRRAAEEPAYAPGLLSQRMNDSTPCCWPSWYVASLPSGRSVALPVA
jgi:hypothetical protein